jgi:hypothetical protein
LRPPTLVGEIYPGDGNETYKRDEPEQPEDPLDCLPAPSIPENSHERTSSPPFQIPQELVRKRRCPIPWANSAMVIK